MVEHGGGPTAFRTLQQGPWLYITWILFFKLYVLKPDEKPHKSDCNDVCKPQKDLQSNCLLSTVSSVSQISSGIA